MRVTMNHLKRSHLLPLAALIAMIFSTGCDDGSHPVASSFADADLSKVAAPRASNAATPLRVMTRNMYLGGDIAIALGADPANPLALIQAVNTVWDQVNYQAKVPFLPGVDIERGWIPVTAELGGIPYHFVNTHLEVQGFAPIQVDQTQELLDEILAGLGGVTVLMGDLNSDAEAGPGSRSWTPTYGMLMDAGFQDAWRTAHPGRPFRGYTCCQAPELDNPVSELGQRIDFVLLRAAQGPPGLHRLPGGVSAEIVGDKSWNRTSPSGLWPSDHAGLLVELRAPQGPVKK
jgi:hypothetical protein